MSSAVQANKTESKGVVFARRLASTVVLLGIVFYGLLAGDTLSVFLVGGIVMLLNIVGLLEFYGMVEESSLPRFKWLGLAGGVTLVSTQFIYLSGLAKAQLGEPTMGGAAELELGVFAVLLLALLVRRVFAHPAPPLFSMVGHTMLGVLYVSWLLGFLLKIYFIATPTGAGFDPGYCLLFFILATKCSDIGAFLLGSMIGRHKMIPKVSPAKTWEGLVGALLLSTTAAMLMAHYWGAAKLGGMTPLHAAALGPLLGVGAVLGDLVESVLKRDSGVKDSGSFFPGIGGILDLLDSLLFNAPLMFLYLRLVLFNE
ncbi:MAG: phosphatidate cytidylyltransferase [Pedosphaera sp.]|nr:phosphatidate cytidylyltransferase [Pedosphaera sp.]